MERIEAEAVAEILIATWRKQLPQNDAVWRACLQLDKLLRTYMPSEVVSRAKRAPKKYRGTVAERILHLYREEVDAELLINTILERKALSSQQPSVTVLGLGTVHRLAANGRTTRIIAAGRVRSTDPDQLEVAFQAREPDAYRVVMRFIPTGGTAGKRGESLINIDKRLFLEHALNFRRYGELITNTLFASSELQNAWSYAIGYRDGDRGLLGVQLRFGAGAEQLHALRWEQMLDPYSREPIALNERVMLHRVIEGAEPSPAKSTQPPSVLAVVAAPKDSLSFRLPLLDGATERQLLDDYFRGVPTVVLIRDAGLPPTAEGLALQLRRGPVILYLVAHGGFDGSEAYIWLEDLQGLSKRVTAGELTNVISSLPQRPALAVLASCQSAGSSHHENTLATLGPTLVRAGIMAVLGMQGNLSIDAAHRMLPVLFDALRREEDLGRAVAAARRQGGSEWWLPVLFLHDGPTPTIPTTPSGSRFL
jgi:CHAT domain